MNSPELARTWTEFLAARSDFPKGRELLEHFNAGTITRICDCGCNSYDVKVPKQEGLSPLMLSRGKSGNVFSLAFHFSDRPGSLEIDVFVDANGYLAGLDVSCNANSEPVPLEPRIVEPPFHIYGPLGKIRDPHSGHS
jgi:hypothetical protein